MSSRVTLLLLLSASMCLPLSGCRRRQYGADPYYGAARANAVELDDNTDEAITTADDPSGTVKKKKRKSGPAVVVVSAQVFRACTVSDGRIAGCEPGSFEGQTVAYWEEAYHSCRISNGAISRCDGKFFQGEAVVQTNGAYKMCRIVDGQASSCRGYQGPAIVYTER